MITQVSVKRNVVANFVGRAWIGAMSFVFVPYYLRVLGIGSYGLIGFYTSLILLLSVLDLGLGTTLNRQLAKLSATPDSQHESRDLVRTLEVAYWAVGILVGVGLIGLAPLVAHRWIHASGVPVGVVQQAVAIMGVVVALQWPVALYMGGMMGLQRQVQLNHIRVVCVTLQSAGAAAVLALVSPTIQAYFAWQVVANAVQTIWMAWAVWRALPAIGHRPGFRRQLFVDNSRFAAGIMGIALLATVLTQMDKVVLSRTLTLEMFGYYALATTCASALTFIVDPVFSALFPRFSQLVAQHREADLAQLYHRGAQLLSVLVLPVWVTGVLFSREILSLWIGNPQTVGHVHYLVSVLITGSALNGIMLLPYGLQLAHGWTRLSFYKNVVAVILFVPLLLLMVRLFGAAGAAYMWIAVNGGYVLFEIPLMHRRILRGEMWRWYLSDVGAPLAVCLCVGLLARAVIPGNLPVYATVAGVALSAAFMLVGAFSVSPLVHGRLRRSAA